MKRAATWLLLLLLAGSAVWWGWRRFGPQPAAPVVARPATPVVAMPAAPVVARPATPVDLAKHDGQTIDFSSGQAVVKDSPEDKAALEAAAKEMAEAVKGVTFDAPQKKPAPAPPKK
jgi:hypothetical protein